MNRLDIKSEKTPNFIGCWYLENKNISKAIIDFFENNQQLQKKGSTAKGIDESKKNLQTLQLVLTSYQILNIKFFKIILPNFKNVLWITESNGLS